jgi:hypothetical protein
VGDGSRAANTWYAEGELGDAGQETSRPGPEGVAVTTFAILHIQRLDSGLCALVVRQTTRAKPKLALQWWLDARRAYPRFSPQPSSRWTKVDSLDSPEQWSVCFIAQTLLCAPSPSTRGALPRISHRHTQHDTQFM